MEKLPNIGSALVKQLNAAGIETYEQLCDIGSKEAWLRVRVVDPSACAMRLYAFEGAIQGVCWHDLTDKTKSDLSVFAKRMMKRKQDGL
ncbi:MAG: TfoX/Sxy family protein [Erysipelotrichaceae bacterium]|jgi:DNA transformation protein|nr:TfoX/Sxy family protein [Erysipelotrichaceae bacterium]